jgi:hypothetical protein
MEYEIFVIDATETPIERPKKQRIRQEKRHTINPNAGLVNEESVGNRRLFGFQGI